jgi:hypothetical protein
LQRKGAGALCRTDLSCFGIASPCIG